MQNKSLRFKTHMTPCAYDTYVRQSCFATVSQMLYHSLRVSIPTLFTKKNVFVRGYLGAATRGYRLALLQHIK